MKRALKKESTASQKPDGKAKGNGNPLTEKIKAQFESVRKGNNPGSASPLPGMHDLGFVEQDGSQGMRFNAEDLKSLQPTTFERKNFESKAMKKSNDEKFKSEARAKDDSFSKQGPPELIKLFRPLSMNMSKTEDENELNERYQFGELDFSSKQVLDFQAHGCTVIDM
jgi:hypothetical protein